MNTAIYVRYSSDNQRESVELESILEGFAEYYSKNLSREVMKGMHETAQLCKLTGGNSPRLWRRISLSPETRPMLSCSLESHAVKCSTKDS